MARAANLFAIGSAAILLVGLLFPFRSGVIVHFGRMGYSMSGRATCFIIAAFFCFFAAIYSLWMLPMNATAAGWHFWLTAASVAGFAAFFALLAQSDSGSHRTAWILAAPAAFSIVGFIIGQAVFAVNLTHAVFKLAHTGLTPRIT